jgi:septal ring factor EnvC (AmiA/AmiB activator)
MALMALMAAAATALAVVTAQPSSAATPSLGQLNSELGQQQARQSSLTASLASLGNVIASLNSQIALVHSREAAVAAALAVDRAELVRVQASLHAEQILLVELRHRLAAARQLLALQLVSSYESQRPDLISVVLDANGFSDLLDQLNFLGRAESEQQTIIQVTRIARAQADRAARRLARLEQTVRQITEATELRARALAGMNALLRSRETALQSARAAQQAALAASQAQAHALRSQIATVSAQQAAAARAAELAAQQATQQAGASPVALGPAGGSGGWAIPYAIVLCESGGQNLPPNSAGASGYYQIIPGTWQLFGGTGPAAYLTGKAEQDAVASRIWNNGAGASNWVCAGIVGIH